MGGWILRKLPMVYGLGSLLGLLRETDLYHHLDLLCACISHSTKAMDLNMITDKKIGGLILK
jgi:hypothetical protein